MQRSLEDYYLEDYQGTESVTIDLLNLNEKTNALLRKLLAIYQHDFYFSANVYYSISDSDNVPPVEYVLSHDLLIRLSNPDGKNPNQKRYEIIVKQTKAIGDKQHMQDVKEYTLDVLATLIYLDRKFIKKIKTDEKKRVVMVIRDDGKDEKRKSLQHGYSQLRVDPTKHVKPPTFFQRHCYIVMRKNADISIAALGQQSMQTITSVL